MEPHTKRIKLSLEPSIEKVATDITDTGHEVYKTELSLPEQLMQNVDRIWYERGDWKDITEEQLKQKIATSEENKDIATTATITTKDNVQNVDNADQAQQQELVKDATTEEETPNVDLGKLRESVISKLYFAKCEIDVALDVINILATENKPNTSGHGGIPGIIGGTGQGGGLNSMISGGLVESSSGIGGNNNLVLPPGTLHATYVSKPKPTEKARLEQAQLTLGLKRTQQKTAADYLKKSAASLKKLVDQEQGFWEEAVRVRSNHWLMQASQNPSTGESGFLIRYGFTDVGSGFGEVSFGEMLRSDQANITNGKQHVQLSLPHNIPKQVKVTIKQNQMCQLGSWARKIPQNILGLGEFDNQQHEESESEYQRSSTCKTQDNDIQQRLINAQSTVFDAELFSRILSEAQVFPYIQCEEDCVIVTLDGQVDILIQKLQYLQSDVQQHDDKSTTTPRHLVGQTIELALRLLLNQRHRFNMWKSRTRLMSTQPKTQQLLNSIGDTTSLPGSVVGTPGSTSVIGSGSNITTSSSTTSGVSSGGTNTPIINHRTLSSNSGATSTSSASSMPRQLSGSASHSYHGTKEPALEVPILAPVLSMTKFWILFDRVRDVVNTIVDPLCGESGIGLALHFKSQHTFNNTPHDYCDAYPSFEELTTSLAINIFKGPSLRFALNQSGTITATLPGDTVILSNVTEFESFLMREINLICLHLVCDIANDLVRRTPVYKNAKGNESSSFIWQVDEVEEILYGAIKTTKLNEDIKTIQDHQWKNITT
ncbi:subunit 17 of mediator complex-domain-containing protein [Halteromyces radiatus]|uniref:subunit 17 of mediator complex-domain-containing protein n=1 Tax=Halteromyces radiatus TaxID=101107 RepID=UPI00221EEBDF|nr:subunit 17 of mediator complex-domain-containing protein [Halteromyces radiatus]KAI8088975.1 subunit 17 of mediator complex-domain-containing protein [Halteromyces radiatus]